MAWLWLRSGGLFSMSIPRKTKEEAVYLNPHNPMAERIFALRSAERLTSRGRGSGYKHTKKDVEEAYQEYILIHGKAAVMFKKPTASWSVGDLILINANSRSGLGIVVSVETSVTVGRYILRYHNLFDPTDISVINSAYAVHPFKEELWSIIMDIQRTADAQIKRVKEYRELAAH
jgi:hypothetical protein